ncbi:uncharacterized protein N7506_009081 [Penicillium brevicompactum]|uniref:uncharacterized protein n=1 Tax=Penicillium brevicompactum TaxID=5074 RepID=UPI0025426706|nr:uncharacterized protein N7506_009081 [Penicillium brevicompactum]KAJ5325979.1 hypothetical protein N7506_009081 [Penicillium brevicompactum]
MSTAPKKEFLCILPDKPGAQAKRLEVRPLHLEGVKPLVASGAVVAGGEFTMNGSGGCVLLIAGTCRRNAQRTPRRRRNPSFKGSMMMVVADSAEQAFELLKKDIYVVSGVWDMDNAQIIPYKSAVREAL